MTPLGAGWATLALLALNLATSTLGWGVYLQEQPTARVRAASVIGLAVVAVVNLGALVVARAIIGKE